MNRALRLVLYLVAALAFTAQAANAQGHKWALLVQVAEHQQEAHIDPIMHPGDLQMDAQRMKEVLELPQFGFTTQILAQMAATHDAVLSALDQLVDKAQPEDAVVFYFSGHGTNVQNQLGLSPWDSSFADASKDITEAELQQRLAKFKTHNVTLILDSCFSMPAGARSIKLFKKFIRRTDQPNNAQVVAHFTPDLAVLFSAAGKNGTAYEYTPDPLHGNQVVGLYTNFLCRELKNSNPGITYRQLSDKVTQDIQNFLNNQRNSANSKDFSEPQTPSCSGSDAQLDRAIFSPVMGAAVVPPPPARPYAQVVSVQNGVVTLNRGSEAEVQVNDGYDVYPKDEQQFSDAQRKLGALRVTAVTGDQATATVLQGANVEPGDRAVLTSHPKDLSTGTTITVRLDGPDAFKTAMAAELSRRFSKFVKTEGDPNILFKGAVGQDGKLSVNVYDSDGSTLIQSPAFNNNSAAYTGANAAEVVTNLTPYLQQLITIQALFKLKNPSPAVSFTMDTADGRRNYVIGVDDVVLKLETGKEGYLFVFDIDKAGTPSLLFPGSMQEDNFISGKKTLPGAGSKFEIDPPAGTETLEALLVTDKASADAIKRRLFPAAATPGGDNAGSRLVQAVSDLETVNLKSTDIWNVCTISIMTSPAVGAPPK